MKTILSWIVLLLFITAPAIAQVDKEFEAAQKALEKELADFQQQNQKEFDKYVDEIDKEFSDYLRESWAEFNLYAGVKPDTTPKPKALPKLPPIKKAAPQKAKPLPVIPKSDTVIRKVEQAEPKHDTAVEIPDQVAPKPEPRKPDPGIERAKPGGVSREIIIIPLIGGGPPSIPPVPNIPVVQRSEPEDAPAEGSFLNFYGTNVDLTYDPNLAGTLPAEIHNTTIADFWDRVNKTNYMGLIRQLGDVKTRMNLNDWGYYLLVKKTAEKISSSQNYSRLLSWFLLTKSGYRTRVSYAENTICLMFPSSNNIYGLRYFMIDNIKFYAPDFPYNQIYTYEKDFAGSSKVFDLNIYNALNIGDRFDQRNFQFSYKGKDYNFPVKYNMNSVEFYKDFPLCEIRIEFDAAITPLAKESLLNALKPQLNGLSAGESVDFLLNFVQNGFAYKTDQEQFNGAEKFFFPEENFYYPYSDCDDRAVLFAYLVRELLSLKVVGVTYPGHIATAVRFPNEEAGDYVMYKGEKYMIADPTYINAPFGMTMPGMTNAKAEIVELANEQNQAEQVAGIWERAEAGGVMKGDNRQNLASDADGNSFITGYFSREAKVGGTTLTTAGGTKDAFLARFNKHGNPEWAIRGNCEGNAMATNIILDPKGNIYICGTFEKSISFGKIMMMSKEDRSWFVAKINADGKLIWLNQVNPDSEGTGGDFIVAASFGADGTAQPVKTYPADDNFSKFGLSFDGTGNIYYTVSYGSTLGNRVDRIALNSEAVLNIPALLKAETDKQVAENCEQTIAGLFGALTVMRVNKVAISGAAVMDAFGKYNPGFKQTAPNVYQSLGKLRIIKNEEGIITVFTESGKPVTIDRLKISDKTRLKAVPLANGDYRIDVLNGVKVRKITIWFPLNYVRLFRSNGNALFDYDSDHSQMMMNMKKDILF